MADAASIKASIDALTAAVAKVAAEVAALKNAPPPPPPIIDQASLDAAGTAIDAATTTLTGL